MDVDESGVTTSAALGGGGSLAASGQENVNWERAQECAPSADGGPFSIGHYPPQTCGQAGRPALANVLSTTGNQYCAAAGRADSGAEFTWHVQLPAAGRWHVDVYVPTWTSYGFGDQYVQTSADGQAQSAPLTQQAYHGSWVSLFGAHRFAAGQDYTVRLTDADQADANCHYELADRMRWVYDGPLGPPAATGVPTISGAAVQGETLTEGHAGWTNDPASCAYQWQDCDASGGGCAAIAGVTGQAYTLGPGDLGSTIVVVETAANAAGTGAPARSAATAVVTAPIPSPTPTPTPTPPPGCATAKRLMAAPASRPALSPARAVARTAHHGARRFKISLRLTPGLARFFDPDQACAQTLTGSGYVNFRRRAARWSVALPSVFHGKLKLVAIGRRTYVSEPQLAFGRKRWVLLSRLSDYAGFDQVPLLRDVAVLTNPLRSLELLGAARHGRRLATAPALTASCAKAPQPVAQDASPDSRHLYDQFSVNAKVEARTIRQWAQSKISAKADRAGVCEESISVENAGAEGFDVVISFTASSQKDAAVKAPQSTATVQWKAVYHVHRADCLDGTWETSFVEPNDGLVGTNTISARALIDANHIRWTRDVTATNTTTVPYGGSWELDTSTVVSDYDGAVGLLVGPREGEAGELTASVVGPQDDTYTDSLAVLRPSSSTEVLNRPLKLRYDCAAGTLDVQQIRTLTNGPPLEQTLHRTSARPVEVTTEQDWRSTISTSVS